MKFQALKKPSVIIAEILVAISIFFLPRANASENIRPQVREYIDAYQEMKLFSGSTLVAKGGKVLAKKGFGMADLENKIPNTPKTKFRIASLTKSFTAMAIMQLKQKGMLSLNDKLNKYIDDYPNGEEISILHLLTHTSGIVNHTELPGFYKERGTSPVTVEETIATFKNMPLLFKPGEKFEYSNSNYILLGFIIEKASGQNYGKFIEENIFKPLDMKNSGFEYYQQKVDNFAKGYILKNNKIIDADKRVMSNAHASGALYSTVGDLYIWDRALYTEKLLDKAALKKMFTPYKDQYGYGWGIARLFAKKIIAHNGDIEGYNTNIVRFVNDDICIIVLSNFEHAPTVKISKDLAAMVLGKKYKLPQKAKKSNLRSRPRD